MESNWSGLARSYLNREYFLKEYLGDDGERATFLAQSADNQPVIVRMMKAESPGAEGWEEHWSSVAPLAHAHLIRILAHDRCRIDGAEYVYVASERPDENLGDVLQERALTVAEARTVLESTLPALRYLRANGCVHTDFRPANIVAVGDRIKLSTDAVIKLPDDDIAARRASAAEIRQVGDAVRAMITQAGVTRLPQPFGRIVEACALAGDDWSPTPAQLQRTLEGGELPRRELEPHPQPVVMKPAPAAVAPTPLTAEPEKPAASPPRSLRAVMAFAGIAALFLIFLLWTATRRGAAESDSTARARTARPEYQAPEPVSPPSSHPSPIAEQPKPTTPARAPVVVPAPAPATVSTRDWGVVAAIYRDYDAAHRRAEALSKSWKRTKLAVYPAERNARRYMVVLASGLSREQAERLRTAALTSGMPSDSYVTRLGF